ncbi:hypothetical protein CEXT_662011 [Caerostris extrusa]|uniref:Uncharacterized protein n=1 Tax=Caerostris extrusa TaxID=172846 RepID=A0AAV4PZU1_CAEEX|nr:hypothetical protein CEXT_662011 [Caerostris extrusa]
MEIINIAECNTLLFSIAHIIDVATKLEDNLSNDEKYCFEISEESPFGYNFIRIECTAIVAHQMVSPALFTWIDIFVAQWTMTCLVTRFSH